MTPEELLMVGGSDVSAILGMNPYRGPIDVWRRCMGEAVEPPNPKILRRGQLMEPVIRAMASEEYDLHLMGPKSLRDPTRPYLRVSLDDVNLVNELEREVVEFKSVSEWSRPAYYAGKYPAHHEIQCQVYMAALGAPRARLIALVGLDDLRQFIIEGDAELQTMLLESVDRFWRDYVVTTSTYGDYLTSRFPKSNGTMLAADDEALTWAMKLQHAKQDVKEVEAREQEARNWLQQRIGGNDGIQGDGWKVTFKSTKGRPTVDWKALAFEEQIAPEKIAAFTKTNPYRVMKLSFKGADNVE
jgi:predicted phage-related endonuclease